MTTVRGFSQLFYEVPAACLGGPYSASQGMGYPSVFSEFPSVFQGPRRVFLEHSGTFVAPGDDHKDLRSIRNKAGLQEESHWDPEIVPRN